MKNRIFIIAATCAVLLGGCKEESRYDIIDYNAPAPAPLTEVFVKPTKGGAVLRYQIPNDKNILCVKAVYEINPGQINETKGSIYIDSLVLKGFGSDELTNVKVFCVGKNGKESTPFIVPVKPLTPVVVDVRSSFIMKAGVGGLKVNYKNDSGESLTYVLMTQNPKTQEWIIVRRFYSALKNGQLLQREMKAKETIFGLYVDDRWGNRSDTLIQTLTPIYEKKVKPPFEEFRLDGDYKEPGGPAYGITNVWDGRWNDSGGSIFATAKNSVMPQYFTIDLKREVELTRIVSHQRPTYTYKDSSIKEFEIWGTASARPVSDMKDPMWIKLGRHSSYQPSGMTGNPTEEDFQYGNVDGENIEFLDEMGDPKPTSPIRFIRWCTYETWNGASEIGEVLVAEIEFFGKVVGDTEEDEDEDDK